MQKDAYICLQLVYASKYLYIWLHVVIYTHVCTILVPKRCADQFIVYSQPGSYCAQHQADTAMVQRHLTFRKRAVAPIQLS